MIGKPTTSTRRVDLDWLRVLAILMIFIFHSGRFFDTLDWHVKNPQQYDLVTAWTAFVASWIMPLIFVVSAASTFYALGTRKAGVFLKDRALRLLVPLTLGVLTHAALQEYLDQWTHRRFGGSFWAFYPGYLAGVFRDSHGNPAFNLWALWNLLHGKHLWYLLILFVFSVVFLPLLRWLRNDTGRRVYERVGEALAAPGAVYLLALPIIGTLLLSREDSLFLRTRPYANLNLLVYAQYFLYGFVFTTHTGARGAVERSRWLSLVAGVLTTVSLLATVTGIIPLSNELNMLLTAVFFALNGWFWVLALLGFGFRQLNASTPLLNRANEAVLPFYILHQSVLLVLGYFVVAWPLPALLKFVLISASSFILIIATYEYLIRRVNVLRFLFGMHRLPRAAQVQALRGAA